RRHTRFSRDWSSDVCSSDLFLDEARRVYFSRHVLSFCEASRRVHCRPLAPARQRHLGDSWQETALCGNEGLVLCWAGEGGRHREGLAARRGRARMAENDEGDQARNSVQRMVKKKERIPDALWK